VNWRSVREWCVFVSVLAAALGLPLLGALLGGREVGGVLAFPPRPPVLALPGFSPAWFGFGVVAEGVLYAALGWLLWRCRRRPSGVRSFPRWGWMALLWLMVWWALAWSRPTWLGPLRDWTFTPLWLGYVAVVDALCVRWRGWSLATRHPRFLMELFPLSAVFWWYFEYLNRFVGNWRYLGVEQLTPWRYFWHATLPFSTVLPAVVSTVVLLGAFFGPPRGLAPLRPAHPRRWDWSGLVLAGLALVGVGAWPQWCFPLVWVAPLGLIVSLQALSGRRIYFHPLARGRWEIVAVPALAGLVCGFFWEMWNYWSEPKWIYTVPWVGAFKLFEMPALGYAGYLPFGLECIVVATWYHRSWACGGESFLIGHEGSNEV